MILEVRDVKQYLEMLNTESIYTTIDDSTLSYII